MIAPSVQAQGLPMNDVWRTRASERGPKSGFFERVPDVPEGDPGARFGRALGGCRVMLDLFACLERLASCDVTLLLEGETGTGKDVLAESVHLRSRRAKGPFVVFDCGATAPTLTESELFGHERGAFTGATGSRPGVFEQAAGGTLFLDELGELPLELQPKLLRVLEKRQVRRLGGTRMIDVDVRIVAATNRQLLKQVELGKFRADLYYRLETTKLTVPALRERLADLPLLVHHFAETLPLTDSSNSLPPAVWERFYAYRWPGNVRELRNAVHRYFLMPDTPLDLSPRVSEAGEPSAPKHLAGHAPMPEHRPPTSGLGPLPQARRRAVDLFEREYVHAILAQTSGNVTRAAALAGVSRQMMTRLSKKHCAELNHS